MDWPWFRPISWYTKIVRSLHCGFNYIFGGWFRKNAHVKYLLDDITFIKNRGGYEGNGALRKAHLGEILRRLGG